jgi:hypothetical protein
MIRKFLFILFTTTSVQAQTWTYEKHGDVIYGHGPHGERTTEENHGGVIYGHDSSGRSWTEENHGGVIYRHEQNR